MGAFRVLEVLREAVLVQKRAANVAGAEKRLSAPNFRRLPKLHQSSIDALKLRSRQRQPASQLSERIMSIDQVILEKLRALPGEKQQEVLDFVEFLEQESARKRPRRSLEGLCADLGAHVTEADITEVRLDMW